MLDLFDELSSLVARLEQDGIEYALCGGLAMAVYHVPRATIDIDLLVLPEGVPALRTLAADLGYTIEAKPMVFADGDIEILRFSKVDATAEDLLSLDLVLATPPLRKVWESRVRLYWEGGPLWVVSRAGLVAMKRMRGSGQDRADIGALEAQDED